MYHIIVLIIFYIIYTLIKEIKKSIAEAIRNRKEQKSETILNNDTTMFFKKKSMSPTKAIWEILKEIGCQPTTSDDNAIKFDYQGASFFINAYDKSFLVTINYPWGIDFKLDEIPDLYALKEEINRIQWKSTAKLMYVINEEHNAFGIHFIYDWIMIPEHKDNKDCLIGILNSLFLKERNNLYDYLHTFINEQKKAVKKRFHMSESDKNNN